MWFDLYDTPEYTSVENAFLCKDSKTRDVVQHGGEYANAVAGPGNPRRNQTVVCAVKFTARSIWHADYVMAVGSTTPLK